jgi:energy-coupling factor transporter ATP-binding protein EcfA2
MKINCKNFGPIKNGSVELSKELIIFCGANNSGKTYFSYLLYGLYKGQYLCKDIEDYIPQQADKESNRPESSINLLDLIKTSPDIVSQSLSKYAKIVIDKLFPDSSGFSDTEISFDLNDGAYFNAILNYQFESTFSSQMDLEGANTPGEIVFVSFRKFSGKADLHFQARSVNDMPMRLTFSANERQVINDTLVKLFLYLFIGETKHPVKFFPAERIAIDIFSSDISSSREEIGKISQSQAMMALVGRGQDLGSSTINNETDNYYAKPIKDSIVQATYISMHQGIESSYRNLGNEIEDRILGGSISFGDKSTNYEIQFTSKGSRSVGIGMASSMVKALASLTIYFKHLAALNDVIIVDEPELCLNPVLQRMLAVILAKASKKGIKVILSTHSDFFIREFNNLIMLNDSGEKSLSLRKKYLQIGYDSNSVLDFKKIGINIFQNGSIDQADVTNSGFEISMIDDAIEAQNEISRDIYFTLF